MDKSPHDQALDPYRYTFEESPPGTWVVKSPQREQPLCSFSDKQSAFHVAFTLNSEYSEVYDKGWERGYDVGYDVAELQAKAEELQAYHPGGLVAFNEPSEDEDGRARRDSIANRAGNMLGVRPNG